MKYINWLGSIDFRISLAALLDSVGIITLQGNEDGVGDVKTPATFEDGTSDEFYKNYNTIIDALIEASRP